MTEADALYQLAGQYQKAGEANASDMELIGADLDRAFTQAQGNIYMILRQAQANAFEKATEAHATGLRFAGQVKAFYAAKDIYLHEQRINALGEALQNVRKYAIVNHPADDQVVIIDLQEKLMPSLYDMA